MIKKPSKAKAKPPKQEEPQLARTRAILKLAEISEQMEMPFPIADDDPLKVVTLKRSGPAMAALRATRRKT